MVRRHAQYVKGFNVESTSIIDSILVESRLLVEIKRGKGCSRVWREHASASKRRYEQTESNEWSGKSTNDRREESVDLNRSPPPPAVTQKGQPTALTRASSVFVYFRYSTIRWTWSRFTISTIKQSPMTPSGWTTQLSRFWNLPEWRGGNSSTSERLSKRPIERRYCSATCL